MDDYRLRVSSILTFVDWIPLMCSIEDAREEQLSIKTHTIVAVYSLVVCDVE